MEGVFPIGPGISRIRGVINMLKQNKGHMEMSKIAEESEEDIDDLLPIIEACKLLGLATIDDSELKLTERGAKLTFSNFSQTIRENLVKTEPFKTTVKIVDSKQVLTEDLFSALRERGIVLHSDDAVSNMMLKKLLIRWGVRSKLLSYDGETDSWSVKKN